MLAFLASCGRENEQGPVWLEAEGFREKGGWVIDQQFMDQMGSPYLMAHGMGVPVEDARTTVSFPYTGNYYVFVRTWDWVSPWNLPGSPGKFKVLVEGEPLDITFGTEGSHWNWIFGGELTIRKGKTSISLHDLTGFNGRCDAIYFSPSRQPPPNELSALEAFRKEQLGLPKEPVTKGPYDLVVAGGGISGICTAVSAARLGLKVALIQNRPVLGGNYSSEIRVHLMGSTSENRYPQLGSIVRELDTGDPGNAGPAETYGDQHKLRIVRSEKNLDLFLNTHVYQAVTEENRIIAVIGRDIESNEDLIFHASWFADCSGDGNLGFMAGADYSYGRESKEETGESTAPETADELTMGSSNLWYASRKDSPSEFPLTEWAVSFSDDYYLDDTRADWRWESGFDKHTVDEAEYIRDLNLRAVYGNWSYLKNNRKEKYASWQLDWVAYIAGKRESRRLLGDVILKEQDILGKTEFPDACVTTTWSIDLHFPDSLNSQYYPGEEFYSWYTHPAIEPYDIPYRSLYSRNIDNLFMAGRCISVTHVALGTVRVMRTGGMMGEVVGMAASICKKENADPGDVYDLYLDQLIRLLHTGIQ